MAYNIELTDEAQRDIGEASNFYLERATSLQDRFQTSLILSIDKLKENPERYQVRYKSIRIAHIYAFPYGIHFIIDGNRIRVLRILHYKQFYK